MDSKKICFILCVNNEMLFNECVEYINRLYIPEGYSIELLSVTGGASMTSGYNEAMKATDAKYKVYMHQDVFIINRYFLYNILDIFSDDDKIGVIGIVGYKTVSPVGMMWLEKRDGLDPMYGSGAYRTMDADQYKYTIQDGYTEVAVADGLLLATASDIDWDEEFDGWDFYDASQCMRFAIKGCKVVVPTQKYPWIVHDDGNFLSLWNYNKYRKLFLEKYVNKKQPD